MKKNAILCPQCGNTSTFAFSARDLNRKVTADEFNYQKCDACSLLFLENVPEDLGKYYEEEYYAIPSLSQLEKIAESDTTKIDTVRKFVKSGKLLEVGPAFGVFACQAKRAGFEVDVIEMSKECCEFLEKTLKVSVYQSATPHEVISKLPAHDVIALWHVIEHLPEPWRLIEKAAENLAPGGVFLIAAPNPNAIQFQIQGSYWPHVDAPRHLTLIPEKLLKQKIEGLGFKQVYKTMSDNDALSWNRFGWQRLLMNNFNSKFLQRVSYVAGYFLGKLMSPLDRMKDRGSAYTLVFQKN